MQKQTSNLTAVPHSGAAMCITFGGEGKGEQLGGGSWHRCTNLLPAVENSLIWTGFLSHLKKVEKFLM